MKLSMFNLLKLRRLALAGLVLLISSVSYSQSTLNTLNVNSAIVKSYDSEAITIAGTALGFTASKINPTCTGGCINQKATVATCVLETGQIRVLSTGTSPTSSVGLLIDIGTTFLVYGVNDIANFKAIRTTSTSGVLNCQYSRIP